jgi:hypothetical protein
MYVVESPTKPPLSEIVTHDLLCLTLGIRFRRPVRGNWRCQPNSTALSSLCKKRAHFGTEAIAGGIDKGTT